MLIWSVVGPSTSISTAVDAMTLVPAAGRPVVIHGIRLGQKTKAQDAGDSMLRIQVVRGNTTAGSGGAAATPAMVNSPSAAASPGATCTAWNTTLASLGTPIILFEDCFDVRAGEIVIPIPEIRWEIPVSTNRGCIRFPDAPAAAMAFSITVDFAEPG